jgi:hypothetical protein
VVALDLVGYDISAVSVHCLPSVSDYPCCDGGRGFFQANTMNVIACIGSGASLTVDQVAQCRLYGFRLATCNQGYKLVPDAEIFHALDCGWWDKYGEQALEELQPHCKIYTGCPHSKGTLVSFGANPKREIHLTGYLSGHNLIELAARENPDLIILIGYDGYGQHWHRDYATHGDVSEHNALYDNLSNLPAINCTPGSKITAFPKMALDFHTIRDYWYNNRNTHHRG